MKKIVLIPVIITLLTIGSYGGSGYIAKRNFNKTMEEINTQIPSHIDITYKQGFFSSTVEISSKIPIADPDVTFEVGATTSHTIYHGPFVFHTMQDGQPAYIPVKAYSEGILFTEFIGDIEAELAQAMKTITTTNISAYVPLFGDAVIRFSGEPIQKELNLGGSPIAVDWQGFNGSLNLHGTMRDFTYDFIAPSLAITQDGSEKITLSSITSTGTARSGSFDIGLGNYKAGIKNITITLSDEIGDEVVLQDLDLNIIANEKDTLLTFSEIFNISSFSFNNKKYGPANMTIHLRNLDAKTLSTMNHEYIEAQKLNGNDPEALQAQLMAMATTHGVTLLSKSPEFEFENISLKTTEGTGEIKLRISFNGEGEVIMNPFFLMGRLAAEASFSADEHFLAALAKEIAQESMCNDTTDASCEQLAARASSDQLQELIVNKQLILENGRYVSKISFKDGAAVLNDAPMPLF